MANRKFNPNSYLAHLAMWSIRKGAQMKRLNTSKLAVLGLLASASVLGACASPSASFGPTHMRNPVQVAESIERLELYTRPNGMELSARDKLAVAQFLDGYGRSGDGPLYINRPANALSGLGTKQAEAAIRGLMAQNGLNPAAWEAGQYDSKPGAPAPVIVSYRTLRAIPQDCREIGNIADTYNNQPHGISDVSCRPIWPR